MTKPNFVEDALESKQTGEVKVVHGRHDPSELTIQQEAHLLHILHVRTLKAKLDKEAAELRERQEKIKYIHEILQDINNSMDDKGGMDITQNQELQEKLKEAKEMGIKLPEGKTTFNTHECKRVIDNLHYTIDDWEKDDSLQMRKLQNMYTESEQSILIAKNTMSSIDKPIRGMISGIKGS